MDKLGWLIGNGWEKFSFRRTSEGWRFEEPIAWPRRTYIVTDAKKAELTGPIRRMYRAQLVGLLFAILVNLVSKDSFFWVIFLLIIPGFYERKYIKPLLADLPSERGDMWTLGEIIIAALSSLMVFAGLLALGVTSKDPWAIDTAVLAGLVTLFFIGFFVVKRRTMRQPDEGAISAPHGEERAARLEP